MPVDTMRRLEKDLADGPKYGPPCPACAQRDAHIEALNKLVKAYRIALDNSAASLKAEGRSVKKAEDEVKRTLPAGMEQKQCQETH